jgi:hypothetical protein
MRVYYVSDPLSADDVAEVEKLMRWSVEQVRVPYLLPTEGMDGEVRIGAVPEAAAAALKAAGILRDYGKRSAFVGFTPTHVSLEFSEAIGRLTGHWPYLIQTEQARAARGNPGELRVLDLDGAMRS